MPLLKAKKALSQLNLNFLISVFTVGISSLIAWRVAGLNMTKTLVDQNSHLNLARQFTDSLTPGFSQIGMWPPLLHIVMAPFVRIDYLYHSGIAGFFVLMPFLVIAALFLYNTCLLITKNKLLSLWATLLFVINPYILYYTATPMMETLFISMLFGTAYFLTKWLQKGSLVDILLTGIFVTLASISRYEGLILIPITTSIVLTRLVILRKKYNEIEATILLFGLLAVTGLLILLSYGYAYANNPLAFMNGQWSSYNQQRNYFLPTEGHPLTSINYQLHASYHILTKPLTLAGFILLPILLLIKRRLDFCAAILVLFSPFLFDVIALVKGNAIIYVPELPPLGVFFNERYGLYWIGFGILVPIMLISLIFKLINKKKYLKPIVLSASLIAAIVTVTLSFGNLAKVAFEDNFRILLLSAQGYPSKEQIQIASSLSVNYDYGKVFITRALNDFVAVNSNIDLKNYIHESNYRFFDQTLERPWLFARWVVMFNPSKDRTDKWALQNEKISQRWASSPDFSKYYSLVVENYTQRLYKIKDAQVIEYAAKFGYDVNKIPSINKDIKTWNASTIYQDFQKSGFNLASINDSERITKIIVNSQLLEFYKSQLLSDYQNGFYTDSQNIGTSESQSYGLLQSYWNNDRQSFDKIWNWTKKNLQRKEDKLFSWKFSYKTNVDKSNLVDTNSATDADTDIAFALILAGKKWSNPQYSEDAKQIINDIWNKESVNIEDKRLVIAGNWASNNKNVIVNPSYFSPAAYRVFWEIDKKHDWLQLMEDGYSNLNLVSSANFGNVNRPFLPSNWITINKKGGAIRPYEDMSNSLDYSYDAFRVFWRIALDYSINKDPKALSYLQKVRIFEEYWNQNHKICSIYKTNPTKDGCLISTSTLAGPLSVFIHLNPKLADELVRKYYLAGNSFTVLNSPSFYDKSWYWFGLALWSGYFQKVQPQIASL